MAIKRGPRQMSVAESSALVLLLALICLTSCRRAGPDPLAHGWDRNDGEPLDGAPILERAKDSRCVWQVDQKPDRITISRVSNQDFSYLHPQEVRVQTANGLLIGENHGEWGGSLSLLVAPSESPRKLLDKNVLQIFPVKSGFAVITGNLPLNQGEVWLYSKVDAGGWSIEKKADLNGYPIAIRNRPSGIFLVRGDGVDVVDADFKVRKLAELPLLGIHPTSVAEDARGSIYIGMQVFVVRLVPNQTGYEHEWFVGTGCLP